MDATVTQLSLEDVLDAAALSIVNARCRQAYVHELRGALQSVQSAIELLSRAVKRPGVDEARLDSIVGLAKRAMAAQEQALMGVVEHMTMRPASADRADLAEILAGVERFLRNDAAHKDMRLEIHSVPDITVAVPSARFRSLLLGLFAVCVDAMPAESTLRVDLSRHTDARLAREIADVEVRSGLSWGAMFDGQEKHFGEAAELRSDELILSALRRLIVAHEGAIAIVPDRESSLSAHRTDAAAAPTVLRIRLPIAGS